MPKACRNQASSIFFFSGASDAEKEKLWEEWPPANFTKKEFKQLINHATEIPFEFLYINKKNKDRKKRYRRTLEFILEVFK